MQWRNEDLRTMVFLTQHIGYSRRVVFCREIVSPLRIISAQFIEKPRTMEKLISETVRVQLWAVERNTVSLTDGMHFET